MKLTKIIVSIIFIIGVVYINSAIVPPTCRPVSTFQHCPSGISTITPDIISILNSPSLIILNISLFALWLVVMILINRRASDQTFSSNLHIIFGGILGFLVGVIVFCLPILHNTFVPCSNIVGAECPTGFAGAMYNLSSSLKYDLHAILAKAILSIFIPTIIGIVSGWIYRKFSQKRVIG
jgi:hypothetical protein